MNPPDNKIEIDFHAVEFMRQVRAKLSQQYVTDKQKYLEFVRQAMADFKSRQMKAIR